MKLIYLVCEAMTDDPVPELGNRTPLEVAETPGMDRIAKEGQIGSTLFTPHRLSATGDVACLSVLGFDPAKHYTGIAPLEALALGIPQGDEEIACRCDLVTVLDNQMIDTSASRISANEAKVLVEQLNRDLASETLKFHAKDGYKNILVINEPKEADRISALECVAPRSLIGQDYLKFLPKGPGAEVVTRVMEISKEILEKHEINRVRVDLKENPANMVWLWGQGKKPRVPSFEQQHGVKGGVLSTADFAKGLAKSLGMGFYGSLEKAFRENDFVLVYVESDSDIYRTADLKTKVKLIETFDADWVRKALALADAAGEARVCVSTDYAASLRKKAPFHGQVPYAVSGKGVRPDENSLFNEKAAAQSKLVFQEGYKLLSALLKE